MRRAVTPAAPPPEMRSLNLGEWAVTGVPDAVLSCLGLGSCVALTVFDSATGAAGMAHVVLPDSTQGRPDAGAKYADVAVPLVLEAMEEVGARRATMRVYLVGGARVLQTSTGPMNDIGDRNVQALRGELSRAGLRIVGEDVGGDRGRTVRLRAATGSVEVSRAGEPARLLSTGR